MTGANFTAPQLDELKYDYRYGWGNYTKIYTKATRKALDELYEEVKKILNQDCCKREKKPRCYNRRR